MREIGFRAHTPDRKLYWQSLTQPNCCYFHRNETHTSQQCIQMNTAITRAANGTVLTSPFVPNHRFRTTQPPVPPVNNRAQATAPSPSPAPSPSQDCTTSSPAARLVRSEAIVDEINESDNVEEINNINYDADYYPPALPNSPCSTISPTPSLSSTHTTFVVDSGATEHMCNHRSLFLSMTKVNPVASLTATSQCRATDRPSTQIPGDGQTVHPNTGRRTDHLTRGQTVCL